MKSEELQLSFSELKKHYKEHEKEILNDYFTFLRFPSISTEANFKPQLNACAEWLISYLKKMGLDVETWKTTGHPTIFASNLNAGKDKPTLLLYNHYDVQPTDPLSEWKSPPFEPTIRDGHVYARGAQDNKGQCFYTLLALKTIWDKNQSFPINIKLCIEGEEEAGSSGLAAILQEKKEKLKADYLAVVDLGIKGPESPSITLGIRGLVTFDVEVQGSNTDLHSGCHGGVVYNPIRALVEILSSLRDESGKITIPGFYDDIKELDNDEKSKISWDFDQKRYADMFDAQAVGGEKDYSPNERLWIRPTLEINGISGGYAGSGFKTVIPAKAHAKISCRLVAGQDPEKIKYLVAKHIEKLAPKGLKVKVHPHTGGGKAIRAKPNSNGVKAFAKAYEEVYKKPCEFILEGASIPIIPELALASQSELALVGLGLSDDQIHAPNERFSLDRLEKGFLIMIKTIEFLGNISKGSK